jgi:hypothetical protein
MFQGIRGRGDFLAVIPTAILKICHSRKIVGLEMLGVLVCFSW